MKKRRIFRSAVLCLSVLLGVLFCLPCAANSALRYWNGVPFGGVQMQENAACPLEIRHETLTFDLQEFPMLFPNTAEDCLAYSGKVTAEYTIYNPADYTVRAALLFPFGKKPHYAVPDNGETWTLDAEKYGISIDGKPVSATVRHTFLDGWNHDPAQDTQSVRDSYIDEGFFRADTPISVYTYRISGIKAKEEDGYSVYLGFSFPRQHKTGFIFSEDIPNMNAGYLKNREQIIGCDVSEADNGREVTIYLIGDAGERVPKTAVYDWKTDEKLKNAGKLELLQEKIITMEDFALAKWKESYGVSKVDFVNAVIDECRADEWQTAKDWSVLHLENYRAGVLPGLMRWYEYEIEVPSGAELIHTVSAPIYPSVDGSYDPPVYVYQYLTSPAKSWKSFGDLDVILHTPYHLIQKDSDGFEKTETGYRLHLEGLPEKELRFRLSTSEHPKVDNPIYRLPQNMESTFSDLQAVLLGFLFIGFCFGMVVLILTGIGFGIRAIVRAARRKKKAGK